MGEKGSAEVTSKPEIAKEDKPNVAKLATEEGGKADDAKKEKEIVKEDKAKEVSKDTVQDKPQTSKSDEEKKDSKDVSSNAEGSAKSVPVQPPAPVHKYF